MNTKKILLTLPQILNMNFGFFGLQYSFGLQQANMSPIYRYLGADEHNLPLLWLAGPVTGLVIQPLIGAMSDNTWNRFGRRRPYFLTGAILASIILILMPYSSAVWMAAGFMWILDASVNSSMEPFRAMVGDILPKEQQAVGFSMQAFLIGVGQLFSSILPYILTILGLSTVSTGQNVPDFVKYAFILGAAIILGSILWTGYTTKEYPPEDMVAFRKKQAETGGFLNAFKEIFLAVKEMPLAMRQMWWVKLACWYGLPLMWQYYSLSIARHVYNAPTAESAGFADGVQMGGVAVAFYCTAPILMSFLFAPLIKRMGTRKVFALFLTIGAIGFIGTLFTTSITAIFALCFLTGIGFSAICTIPYIMLSTTVPPARMGVYMGILNAFICIPQIISMLTVPLYYDSLLAGDPRNAVILAGICWIIAAVLCLRITPSVENIEFNQIL